MTSWAHWTDQLKQAIEEENTMANRTLVHYEEERNPEGPYWTLDIDRSAAGQPGLLLTIKTAAFGEENRHIESLNHEMTIVVDDGNALLAPVLEWLKQAEC